MQKSIFDSAINSANQNAQIITEWLDGIKTEIEDFANTEKVRSMNWEEQKSFLSRVKNSKLESMIVTDINGRGSNLNGDIIDISDQEYFKKILNTKSAAVSTPRKSKINDNNVIIVATPIFNENNQMIGIIGGSAKSGILQDLVEKMKINGYGNGWIIDEQMTTIAHPNNKYLGNKDILEAGNQQLKDIALRMAKGEEGIDSYKLNGLEKIMAFAPIDLTGWSIAMGADQADILSELINIRNVSLMVGIIGILIGVVVTYFIARYIADPINDIIERAEIIAKGDFSRNIANRFLSRNDEIGKLAQVFHSMTLNLRNMVIEVRDISSQVAASSEELSASGDQVGEAAEEVSSAIQGVASGAEEQSAQIDETRDNIGSLIDQINDVSESSNLMNESAADVMASIKKGNNFLDSSIVKVKNVKDDTLEIANTIHSLGKLSEEIGDIIDIINGIAAQTNLLALNAAIEAARAGEAGRGFSVVADEIRELAEESSNSTEKIDILIRKIQNNVKNAVRKMEDSVGIVDESVDAIEETGQSFDEINDLSDKLVEFINDISAKAQQMTANSTEVNGAIKQIAAVSQEAASNSEEVAASTEEQNAATEEIISAANELAKMANHLAEVVNKFKI